MNLSIIIVNWNAKDVLRECLESIFKETKQASFEIFVVDNNSSDGSQAMLREFQASTSILYSMEVGERLHLILNAENAGFAKANNQALRKARGEFVLFLNPDTKVLNGALDTLMDFMRAHEEAAACAGKLLNQDGTLQPNIKRHPTFFSQVLIMLKLHHTSAWCQTIEHYLAKDFDYTREQEVEQIMGAFFFARKKYIDELHGWDEDYWLWWEDVQLCTDFKKHDWKILYTPTVAVMHYEGKSFSRVLHVRRQRWFSRGMIIYFRKNGKPWQVFLLYLLNPLSLLLAWLAQIGKIAPRPQSKI